MRPTHLLWLGAAGAIAIVVIVLSSDPRGEPRSHSSLPREPHDPRLEEICARLDDVALQLERLDPLGKRVEGVESGLAAIHEQPGTVPAATSSPEHERLLYQRAKELSADKGQDAEAIDAWASFAENTTDPERQAEAWLEQAKLCCDQEIAAELLTKAVETAGLESEIGQNAAFLLGFCQQGDISASLRIWRQLAATPGLSKDVAVRTRKTVADRSVMIGDYETALREYERFAADYRNDENEKYRKLAESATNSAEHMRNLLKD